MKRPVVLRAWVAARLPVLALGLGVAWPRVREAAVAFLTHDPFAHSAVKGLLLVWQTALLRGPDLLWLVPLAAATGAGLTWLGAGRGSAPGRGHPTRDRRWELGAGFAIAAVVMASHSVLAVVLGGGLLVVQTLPSRILSGFAWRAVAGVPGSEVLATRVAARAVGHVAAGSWLDLTLGAAGGTVAALVWFGADIAGNLERSTEQLARWPDARVDPRATVLDRVAPPSVFDFQDIDRVGDHLVVMGENPPRLLAYPLSGGPASTFLLRPFWAHGTGMAVESASDPTTGRTWFLAGPQTLAGARYVDGAWTADGESAPLARGLLHGTMEWFPERQRLVMITVNVAETRDFPRLVEVDTPGLDHARVVPLVTADGAPLPVVRDAVWVPPLRRFVLAPDFGGRLYLADPETGVGEPWLDVAALNGRLVWDDALARLFVARPERAEVAVIDPVAGRVERTLSTARGVRAIAVDAGRGLLLTASVISGAVDVLRLGDGTRVDRFTGFMPMVRNLLLVPERGEAVLSSWAVLYRFPYAEGTP